MKRIKNALFIFFFIVLTADILSAQEITVLFSGQTHAMLYPCSCPIQADGGIARRGTLVKELRKKYPALLLLDCGSFTAGGLMDEYTQSTPLDMQRSEVNYKAMELMQYDAASISPDEFNFGKEFFLKNAKQANPAYLSANLDSDKVLPYIIKDVAGVRIGIIGLTALSANQNSEGLKINPPGEVGELVSRLKKEGAQVVILLSTLGEKEDLKLISKVKDIDIIFVGYHPIKDELFTKVEGTFFLRPSWQGRKLGKLILKISSDGKLADCKAEEQRLSDEIADDAGISKILPRCYADANCREKGLVGSCQNPGTLKARCAFIKPNKIDLLVISAKDCLTCNEQPAIDLLKKRFPGLTVKYLYYPDAAAQKLIKKLSLRGLPAYILGKEIEKEDNFESFKNDFQLIEDSYIFKPQVSGMSYFLNRQKKQGSFDLFFSPFAKDAGQLLEATAEFKPNLHFLVVEKVGGFEAENGIFEIEECLRAGCVQKYYPEKFLDYLICRSKNINSSYWEDCLSTADSAKIKTCARGDEGIKLLQENISLGKELQISTGPSYLLNNYEIFSSRGVPGKEELRKIIKKDSSNKESVKPPAITGR